MNRSKLFIPLAASVFFVVSANSLSIAAQRRIDLLGDPAPPTAAVRTIVIHPNTKQVNVRQDEIIKFVTGDKTFAWNFNGPETVWSFKLSRVAPAGVLDHEVTAYIEPLPRSSDQ